MHSAREIDQQAAQCSPQTKPTMLDLWLRHPEIQTTTMIELPGIPYVRVLYAFCGYPVSQREFDAVLQALNYLTGCHYTWDEIAGVQIAPQEQ